MVRRIAVLGTLLTLSFAFSSAARAQPARLRLSGSFARVVHLPQHKFRFVLRVRSPEAVDYAHVSLMVLAKEGSDETLFEGELEDQPLKKGTTRLVFNGKLSQIGAIDGVYPVEVVLTTPDVEERLGSRLVVIDPKRHRPMPVAIVWNVVPIPSISPKTVYLSRAAPGLVRGGKQPGYLAMHVGKLIRHTKIRASFNVTPETLTELLGIARGYRVREYGKTVRVGSDSPEAGDARVFFGRFVELMRSGRVEEVSAPYAYPALPELAARGWKQDVLEQLWQGQDIVERTLRTVSSPGIFSPDLRLPKSIAPLLRRAGAEYSIVAPFDRSDPFRAYRVEVPGATPFRVAVADTEAERIIRASRSPQRAAADLLLHLAKVRLERGRRPAAAVIVLPARGQWRPSSALVDAIYATLASSRWIRTVTLGSAVAAGYGKGSPASLREIEASGKLKPYYRDISRARWSLAVYLGMARKGNSTARRIKRNFLIAQSAVWTSGNKALSVRGLRFADDVTRTVAAQLSLISMPTSQTITLPTQSGKVPVPVTNGTRYPLRVTLRLSGAHVEFPEGRVLYLELKPGDNFLTVPVAVSSDVPARVDVRLVGGGAILGRSVIKVRTTYFNRMVFLGVVILFLLGLLVVIYRRAGRAGGR